TLRWDPPDDAVANFVVFVNGAAWQNLGGSTYEVKLGAFDAGDTRTFAVVAIDKAGNLSASSAVLVGVPNLVGLTIGQAERAASARGLVVHRGASVMAAGPMVGVSQTP